MRIWHLPVLLLWILVSCSTPETQSPKPGVDAVRTPRASLEPSPKPPQKDAVWEVYQNPPSVSLKVSREHGPEGSITVWGYDPTWTRELQKCHTAMDQLVVRWRSANPNERKGIAETMKAELATWRRFPFSEERAKAQAERLLEARQAGKNLDQEPLGAQAIKLMIRDLDRWQAEIQ